MNPLRVYRARKINSNNQLFRVLKWQVILNRADYFLSRQWCFEFFGPSIEYHYFKTNCKDLKIEPVWSWDTHAAQEWKGHLYFKDDYELDLFEKQFDGQRKV